jgi:hypothetical protein
MSIAAYRVAGFGSGQAAAGSSPQPEALMRTVSPIVYASVVGLLFACSDSTGPEPPVPPPGGNLPEGAFQVSPGTATLQSGQTFRFTTTYSGNPALVGRPGDAVWSSTNENVATVSGGLVRTVGVGQTRIVATWGGYQASALLKVVAGGKKPEDLSPGKKHENPTACLKRAWRPGQRLLIQC